MVLKIEQDHSRFKQIVRGRIKQNLRKFISQGEMIGKQGKKYISIPVPQIDIPHFRYSDKQEGGVGEGEGDPGSPVNPDDGSGKAGNLPGQHILETEVSFEELAALLGEELNLPKIQPKKGGQLVSTKNVYRGIRTTGPESLRHYKRTYKQALKRQIVSGQYNPEDPRVIPYREDKRYRSYKVVTQPENKAVIFYIMDVSGSMGANQKEIVRIESFWLDTWLKAQYKGLETRYIIHDAVAREVDANTFYHTRESGGTMISSAYKLALDIITERYNPNEWNIYLFQFSDGDNWSSKDTEECLAMLENDFFPICNQFAYGQVQSDYGSGEFLKSLAEKFGESHDILITSTLEDKEDIPDSIKLFLGRGK